MMRLLAYGALAVLIAGIFAGCTGGSGAPQSTPAESRTRERAATEEPTTLNMATPPTPQSSPSPTASLRTPAGEESGTAPAFIKSVEYVKDSPSMDVTIHNREVGNDMYLECTFNDRKRGRTYTEEYEFSRFDENTDEYEPFRIDRNSEQLFEFLPVAPLPGMYDSRCDLIEDKLTFDVTHHEFEFEIEVTEAHFSDPKATLTKNKCELSSSLRSVKMELINYNTTGGDGEYVTAAYATEFFIWVADDEGEYRYADSGYQRISTAETFRRAAAIEELGPGNYVLDCVLTKRLLSIGWPPNYLGRFDSFKWLLHTVEFVGAINPIRPDFSFAFLPWGLLKYLDKSIIQHIQTTAFTVNQDLTITYEDSVPEPPDPPSSFKLDYDISESSVEFGDSFTLAVRMYGLQQAGEHGGISVSFPALTESGGSSGGHSSSAADVEAVDYTAGLSKVKFYQPESTIYRYEREPTPFPAEYLLVESDDASWSRSDDRTLRLRITPKFIGEFPILIRGWVCAEEYTDCSRNPDAGTVTDQQGWIVEQVSVQVENFELPPIVDPHYSQWERFIKPGVHENANTYIPQISDFGDPDTLVDDGSFLIRISDERKFELVNTVVGFRTWLYHEGSATYEVGISGDDGVALYANEKFVAGRGNAEDPASYGPLTLNDGWNKIEALVYNGPLSLSLKLEPALSKLGVMNAIAGYGALPPEGQEEKEGGRPDGISDTILLLGGTINAQPLDSDAPMVTVPPGARIQGVVGISVYNSHGGHTVFPVGATPSWGSHESSYWAIDGWAPAIATTEYEVPINLTAPVEPGTYAIIFAALAETSLAHVMSTTPWPTGDPRWNDGDDVASWGDGEIGSAIHNGYVHTVDYPSRQDRFGAAVIRIEVVADPAVKGMHTRYASVSAGQNQTCAVRQDRSVTCWGRRLPGLISSAEPKSWLALTEDELASFNVVSNLLTGEFASVSVGYEHVCGVRMDGSLVCRGNDSFGKYPCDRKVEGLPVCKVVDRLGKGFEMLLPIGVEITNEDGQLFAWIPYQSSLPEGKFVSVSAGQFYTCALRQDSSIVCWGNDEVPDPPGGRFVSVNAGWNHACGVMRDGSVVCWGTNSSDKATPPKGRFSSVNVSKHSSCGVRANGSVVCWGHFRDTAPTGAFASVSVGGEGHACGLMRDDSVACWGDDEHGQATPPEGPFVSVSAGEYSTCGVRQDGSLVCWGEGEYGQATSPEGPFVSVSAGDEHACGVRVDGSVVCWGDDYDGRATPPEGPFVSVSAGDDHTCGVRVDGSAVCWGDDYDGQATPPGGLFVSVSAGYEHTCGVRVDGSAVCWGDDDYGKDTPPGGLFVSVSAGYEHTCGVRVDGSAVCWGYDYHGQATPPGGLFVSVSAGYDHTCGVRVDGSAVCWGDDDYGQATPPGGLFVSVSAGDDHTCWVRQDGSVVCRGDDDHGQATSPGGLFVSVSAGDDHTCWVRQDGSVVCRGHLHRLGIVIPAR